jgi:hypothetical protein
MRRSVKDCVNNISNNQLKIRVTVETNLGKERGEREYYLAFSETVK